MKIDYVRINDFVTLNLVIRLQYFMTRPKAFPNLPCVLKIHLVVLICVNGKSWRVLPGLIKTKLKLKIFLKHKT